ncbi:MAG: SDR family oxidoreductase [Deltaproteobacteria bacterium]|nr:SDR family oxidoreductase [Deltaproteobacteria bacterium]
MNPVGESLKGTLEGKAAIVTGAARGLGRAMALAFADAGALLALCDREGDELALLAEELRSRGSRVVDVCLDLRDPDAVRAFVQAAVEGLGRLDVVINNAGGTFAGEFVGLSDKGVASLVDENFGSVVNVIRAVSAHLGEGASIINITSVEAHRAAPGFAVYAAMKAAVESLTRSLALELGARGIRVNCIAPDAIVTEGMPVVPSGLPLAREGRAEDVAAAALFLAGDGSAFITGDTLHVDGGEHCAGGWSRGEDGSFHLPASVEDDEQ